jgi:tyrosinase
MNQDLNQEREGLVGTMFNLLTIGDYKDYRMFSNHSTQSRLARGSVEGFHDQYHGIIGGFAGHMSYPPIAAFDPVFWLHHW